MAALVWDDGTGRLQMIEFDAVLAERHGLDVDVTQHPVEEGSDISDHIRPKPRVVEMTVMTTNHPLRADNAADAVARGAVLVGFAGIGSEPTDLTTLQTVRASRSTLTGAVPARWKPPGFPRPYTPGKVTPGTNLTTAEFTASANGYSPPLVDRVKTVFDALTGLAESRRTLTLVTDLQEYPMVAITKLSAPVTVEKAIRFDIDFTIVKQVSTQVVDITKRKRTEGKAQQPSKPPLAKANYLEIGLNEDQVRQQSLGLGVADGFTQ